MERDYERAERMLLDLQRFGHLRVVGSNGKPFTIRHRSYAGLHGYAVPKGKYRMLCETRVINWLASLRPA